MMKLLHIDSSILGSMSVSRRLSSRIVARLKSITPDLAETYRDLSQSPVAHLSGAYLTAAQSQVGQHEHAIQDDLADGSKVMQEFLAADIVVIGVAFYNFTISSQLKSWLDRIVIAGQTFRYGAEGRPEGLVSGKRLYLAIARGGFYGPGALAASAEHAESYLRAIFGFMGITNPNIIIAEGLAVGPDHRQAAIIGAEARIAALV